ncbi:MAG: hypothetical protein E7307_00310 [Butyrivibrio sp.]|nr:hypothetical protein [Butyrivibrio sp.]
MSMNNRRIAALLLAAIMCTGTVLPAYGAEEVPVSVSGNSAKITAASTGGSSEASTDASVKISDEGSNEGSGEASIEKPSEEAGAGSGASSGSAGKPEGSSAAAAASSSENKDSSKTSSEASGDDVAGEASSEASSDDVAEEVSSEASLEASSEASSEESDAENYDNYPTGYNDLGHNVEYESVTKRKGSNGLFMAGSLPARYATPEILENMPDLRDQSPYGTCWAFATTAIAEISLAKQGYNVDLSELHLAYFANHFVDDPLGGFGECEQPNIPTNYLDRGGNFALSFPAYARWNGAASEEIADYRTDARYAKDNGLGDDIAYEDVAHIVNYYVEPVPEDRTNLDAVKKLIMEHGAVAASIKVQNGTSAQTGPEYNSDYNSFCHVSSASGNGHAVALVGWDDNFPKEHFSQVPEGDGAFLVRNSWTTGTYESNQTFSGYFWMSYYESTLNGSFYAADFEMGSSYDNNYQYDQLESISGTGSFLNKGAAFYTAHADGGYHGETIEAVSFGTTSSNLELKISVYTGLADNETNPENGELASTVDVVTSYAGYYTVPLTSPVSVAKGENFSVVIENKADGYFGMLQENSLTFDTDRYAPSNSGKCSYTFSSGDQSNWASSSSDLMIKVFTDNSLSDEVPPTDISFPQIGEEGLELTVTEKKKISALISPEDASNKELVWESSDESVATVNNGVITGKGVGTATITARAVLGNESGHAEGSFTVKVNDTLKSLAIVYMVSRKPLVSGDQISVRIEYTPVDYAPKKDPVWTVSPEGALVPGDYGQYRLTTPGYMTHTIEVDGMTATRNEYVFPGASWFDYYVDDDNTITFRWKAVEGATKFRFYTDDKTLDKTVTADGSDEYTLVIDEYAGDGTFKKKDIKVATYTEKQYQYVTIRDVGPKPSPCVVHFESGGGSAVADIASDYKNAIAKPTDPTRYGHTFAGWYKDSGCTEGNEYDFTKKIRENIASYSTEVTLYAKWERNPDDIMITGISITTPEDQNEIKAGVPLALDIEYFPENATLTRVTWKSSNPNIATVDADGNITGIRAGSATITVVSDADNSISASYKVLVWTEASGRPAKEVRILDTAKLPHFLGSSADTDPTTTLYGDVDDIYGVNVELPVFDDPYGDTEFDGLQLAVGKSVSLKADFLPKDTKPRKSGKTYIYADSVKAREVIWRSYNSGVAAVDSKGKVTAKGAGITTIEMTSVTGDLTASCEVMVYDPVTKLSLNATGIKLGKGQTFELEPVVSPATASNKVVYGDSSNPNVATIDKATGVITAGNTAGKAVFTVTAQGGKSVKCTVNVGNAVESLRLYEKKNSDSVAAGKTLQLLTEYNGGDKKNQPLSKDVIYGIVEGNNLVASNEIASITQKGVLKGLSEGKVTVKVMSKTDMNGDDYVSDTYDVYVYSGLKSAALNRKTLTMTPGGEYTLRASVKSLTNSDYVTGSFDREAQTDIFEAWNAAGKIEWKAVPENGTLVLDWNPALCDRCRIIPAEGFAGTATVTATFRPCGATKDTVLKCKVVVKDGAVTGLTPKPTSVSISRGEVKGLSATLAPIAPDDASLSWEIDDAYADDLCFVDENGAELGRSVISDGEDPKGNSVRIKALSLDVTTSVKAAVKVTTNAKDKNGRQISKNIPVTVLSEGKEIEIKGSGVKAYGDKPDEIEATPLCVKKSISLKAVVYADADKKVKAGNQKVTWSVYENPQVASVNASGKVTALSNGVATIAATSASGNTAYVKIGVYSDVTKLTLDKTKISMSTEYADSQSTLSNTNYAALTALVTPQDLFENDKSYSKYADKVTWTASGTGVVELAAIDADELSGTVDKRIDAKQEILKSLDYKEPESFEGTGAGQVLAIKAVSAGKVKLTARAGSRKATCTVTIYSHVTGVELPFTNTYLRTRSRVPLTPRLEIDGVPMPVKPIAPRRPSVFDPDYPQKWEAYQIALEEYYTKLAQYNAALPRYNALKKMAVTTTVYYESSDEDVATVDSKGLVTAKAPGKAVITATTAEGYNAAKRIAIASVTVE